MRKTTATISAVGAALMLASAATAAAPVASAEPTDHQVLYTLTSSGPGKFQVYYAFAAPPSKDAYEADPNAYVRSESVTLDPGAPWTLPVTLSDPQAAFISVSGAAHAGQADPFPTCLITIDGQPGPQASGPFTTQCELRSWQQPW